MVARYRSVLSVPGSPACSGTALIGRLPQGMTSLAILLLVRTHTGSYAAAGIAVGAYDFATAAGAPLLGRLVDRFGRGRVLAPVAITPGVVLVALVVAAHGGAGAVALVALSALAGALLPPIAPVDARPAARHRRRTPRSARRPTRWSRWSRSSCGSPAPRSSPP